MTHFGIICPAASGHLNPMITLGYELQKRGHRVTLLSILDAQSKAIAAGLEFRALGEEKFPLGWIAQRDDKQGKLSGLAAIRYTISWLEESATMLFQEAPEAIKAAEIEALLVDQASPEGGTVAEFLDVPFVTVCNALMLNRDDNVPPFVTNWNYNPAWWARLRNRVGYELIHPLGRPIRDIIAKYRQKWKLPPHLIYNDYYSQLAQISQQPAEFEFPRKDLPSCFHFTGPYHYPNSVSQESIPFPYEKLTGQPLIYASLGTLQNRLIWVFQMIAEACMGLDTQLVITLGWGTNPESLPEFPGNPLVVGYAPQLELLQKATLTITHAGMNTTLHSLSNGVPLVSIPITNEQPGIAARVAWTGTGEVIPIKKVSMEKLQKAIKQVLTEDFYKQNAVRLQEAIHRAGGVSRAADIIEEAVSTRKPVFSQTNSYVEEPRGDENLYSITLIV